MQALDTPAYSVSHGPEILPLNIQFVPSYLFAAVPAVDYSLIPATLHYSRLTLLSQAVVVFDVSFPLRHYTTDEVPDAFADFHF